MKQEPDYGLVEELARETSRELERRYPQHGPPGVRRRRADAIVVPGGDEGCAQTHADARPADAPNCDNDTGTSDVCWAVLSAQRTSGLCMGDRNCVQTLCP